MGANLSGVFLVRTALGGAILSMAAVRLAMLSGAYLGVGDLSNTDLSHAILSGAKVATEQLDQAKSLKGVIMPDWSIHA